MSDDTQPPQPPSPVPPPSPLGKTQAVPLKKETVRITLRAKPGESGEGAPAAPATAPLRPAAPPPAVARPAAPPPPAGAVGSRTIPLSPAPSAPRPPGSPAAPAAAAPAPTRPMTTPLSPAPSAARPTVRLQPQQGAGAASGTISSAPLKPAAMDDEDETTDEGGLGLLAGIAAGLAALFLLVSALSSDSLALGVSLDQKNPGWKIPRPSPLNSEGKAKEDFARQEVDGTWSTDLELAEVPQFQAP